MLQNGLAELRSVKLFKLYNVRFLGFLSDGLSSIGEHDEVQSNIEAAIRASEDRRNCGVSPNFIA